ncbi:aminotransferase class V-fold PLP-dependent enzyme [Rhodobacterales bacterium LSUCC0387]|nr:aminotransferase class V-fold PLP-dependent enzyme [Rhodobacterales bacterium LSUCC0387]
MSKPIIASQKHLFDIPDEVAYLNTAYMSPLMHSVIAAIDEGVRLKAQPWRLTIDHFFEEVDTAKKLFGQLVNAPEDRIAVVPSASYGLSTAANNIPLTKGQRIITLKNQFPSHTYPWKRKARETGGDFVEVDVPQGAAATAALLQAIDERTAVVAVPNVLWTTGAYVDLVKMRSRCDEVGAALVLDLTQSAGALVTDFTKIRPDFAAVANYKWMLCPYSTGFLYVDPTYFDGKPLEDGWVTREGGRNFSRLTENPETFEAGAVRYDMGERANFALLPGVNEALRQLLNWNVMAIESTLAARNADLCRRLNALGLKTVPAENRGAHFIGAQLPPGVREDLLLQLAKENVYLSERAGSLRITPHLWNDDRDFDRLINTLGKLV